MPTAPFRCHVANAPPPPVSICKSRICVSIVSACAAAFLLVSSATAQLLPSLPSSYKEWNGPNIDGSWGTGPWIGGSPGQSDNVFFAPSTEQADLSTGDHTVRSLWFEAGSFYTLNGSGTIKLDSGTPTGHVLVVTNDASAPKQSETHIASDIQLDGSFGGQDNRARIENWSEGGLLISGLFKSSDHNVQFGGSGAIHISNRITNQDGNRGNSNFYIQGSEGTAENVHVILSGNNDQSFGGILRVNNRGFLIVKEDQALGEGSNKVVNLGGTLALRSHRETPLTYAKPGQNNYISLYGDGIVRIAGTTKRIGALYNDGGWNSLEMRIDQTTSETAPTGFGSRGDRSGGLELRNYVGLTTEFHKLGPGLIVLNNQYGGGDANSWGKDTRLKAGVLRIANANSLPTASNLVFDGGIHGGILELGYGSSWSRSLGTGNNQVRWTGDGGFSAYGTAREVKIVDAQNNLVSLTWGSTEHFLGDGHALLLSSRYADNVITLTNAINLNGQSREVRVARGENTAYGVLSGVLSGSGGGLLKTGDGLLHLTDSNTYTGATEIRAGALRGADGNSSSNIVLAGGILGLDADFTRGLGTGGSQIQWAGSGGFAAYGGGERSLQLGGNSNTVNWGDANFIQDGEELRFGHYSAHGTIVWHKDKEFALGSGTRTIRVERAEANKAGDLADVHFAGALTSANTTQLYLVGNGLIDFSHENAALLAGKIMIYGAELRLHGPGRVASTATEGNAPDYFLRYGGKLTLDNNQESSENDRIHNASEITLATGALTLQGRSTQQVTETLGKVTIDSGANVIDILSFVGQKAELFIDSLLRGADSRSTLDVTLGADGETLLRLKNSASAHALGGIIPWATTGKDWLAPTQVWSDHYLRALDSSLYETGSESGWSTAHNIKTAGDILSANREINSLILNGNLILDGYTLTINSGGLLVAQDWTMHGASGSTLTTGSSDRPLYIHNNGRLTLGKSGGNDGYVEIKGGMDVVKSGTGVLVLNGGHYSHPLRAFEGGNHQIGDLYIHQGTVILLDGTISVKDRIYIGDGAGTDKLILPPSTQVWNPIRKAGGGLPSITLRGTPYDPRGPEYGGDQAILQLGGDGPSYGAGTKQKLANLHIDGRGTIDFRGGDVGLANTLWIDELTFSSTSDILFIRNWYEYEDLFLVKKVHNGVEFDQALLPQILFEGYQDYETTLKDYNADYWQITPFGNGVPEPATYGAILGAVGIGLVAWRKKTQRQRRCAK